MDQRKRISVVGSSLCLLTFFAPGSASALTLRPAALAVVAASADGTLDLRLTLVFGNWGGPVRIDEPPVGDVSP